MSYLIDFVAATFTISTLAKTVYSVLLIAIIIIVGTELKQLWFDKTIYLSTFEYFEEGGAKADKGKSFTLRIIDLHNDLRYKFEVAEKEAKESVFTEEQTWATRTSAPIRQPSSVLSEIDITVQSIKVTEILAKLRRWISGTNYITGSVSKTGKHYRGSFTVPAHSIKLAGGSTAGRTFHFEGKETEHDAAFDIACAMIWRSAAASQEEIARVGRPEFCHWATAWHRYLALKSRHRGLKELSADNIEEIEEIYNSLSRWITEGVVYPKYYALRADLVELLPDKKRAPFLVQQQHDRIRYAVLLDIDPKKRTYDSDPLNDIEAMKVLAKARPAIPIADGKLSEISSPAWKRILQSVEPSILSASKSVGRIGLAVSGQPRFYATCFVIAPETVITVGHLFWINNIFPEDIKFPVKLPENIILMVSFADTWPSNNSVQDAIRVKKLLFSTSPQSQFDFSILEVDKLDKSSHPHITIGEVPNKILDLRSYVGLIGYPSEDRRLPSVFLESLLSHVSNIKRLLPGRIIGTADKITISGLNVGDTRFPYIVSDISTSGGVAGAPLIEFHSGNAIGLHFAGFWKNVNDGKFAYAQSLVEGLKSANLPLELFEKLKKSQPALQ
jgi:hypothetical protein